ncbi:MAG: hypothetical protein HGA98_00250 [Deltaproteobacteria bacterium]|nr:hypothetical protein [Deltaproteobacteria bacterium]
MTRRILPTALRAALLTLLALVPGRALAGAWTQPKGALYDRVAANYYSSTRDFDSDGDRQHMASDGRFFDANLSNYVEYGLTDRLTLINALYYKYLHSEDTAQESRSWGVGDIDVAARFKLAEGSFGVLSAQALVKIPKAYDEHDDLPLGNGQWDVEAKLLYGRSLWALFPGYFNLELGYRWRAEDPSDEIRYLAEVGSDFGKSFYGRVKLDGIYSRDNGRKSDGNGNPTTTNSFDLAKLDVTLGYRLTPSWSLEAAWTPAVYGQNTAAGATYTLALAYQTR